MSAETTRIEASGWVSLPSLSELIQRRELLFFLAWRDISARYKQSILGVLWAVIQPLAMMVVFTLVFDQVADLETGDVPYPALALTGLVVWQLFARTLGGASNVIVANGHMVTKVYFPRLILPLASSLASMVDFVVSLPILLVVVVLSGIGLSPTIVLLPLFALLAMAVALGVGLWLSAINVHYRDVAYVTPFLLQVWLFLTPVAYPISALPERWQPLATVNPMTGPVESFRWAILGSTSFPLVELVSSVVIGTVLLVTGAVFFQSTQRTFADVV